MADKSENTNGTEIGNQVVGNIAILYGTVKAVSSDGTERILTLNDPIFADDKIITESDGRVSIVMDDGARTQIDLGRMSEIVIDEDIFQGVSPEEVSEAAAEIEEIQEALLTEDFDPTLELEAAAAGGDAAAGGGSTLPEFERVAPEVEVTVGAETEGITTDTPDPIPGVPDEQVEEPEPIIALLTLTASETVEEGNVITYTATLTELPEIPVTVELSNGATIIIPAGQTSASVEVDAPADDVYIDPETVEANIVEAAGGGFDELDVDETPAVTAIPDTIDPTVASLIATPIVPEGETEGVPNQITYTAELTNPPQGPVTITLSNGEVINISDGETSGSVTVDVPSDDVYVDPETIGVTIASATTDNFEQLVINPDVAETYIPDTIDITPVHLSTSDEPETATSVTFNIHADNPPDGGAGTAVVQVAGEIGTRLVNIDANGDGAFVVNFSDDDVYNDADSISAEVLSIEGNYEAVDLSDAAATANILEVIDPTYVSISGPSSLLEGGEPGTYTLTLTNPPESDVTVNLSYSGTADNGVDFSGSIQFIFDAGTYDFDISTVVDALESPPEYFKITIDSVSGGNFESVAPAPGEDSVTTTIFEPVATAASVEESDMDLSPVGDLAASTSTGTTPEDDDETATGIVEVQAGMSVVATNGTTSEGNKYAIDDQGNYIYTLVNRAEHNANNDPVLETITYQTTNGDLTIDNTLTISIYDDEPTMDVTNLVIPNIDDGTWSGTYDFDVGADVQALTESLDADSLLWTNKPDGFSLNYDGNQTYTATYVDGDETPKFFTVKINDDGTYDFTLDEAKPVSTSEQELLQEGLDGGSQLATYTFGSELFNGHFELIATGWDDDGASTLTISESELGVAGNTVQEQSSEYVQFDYNSTSDANVSITDITVSISDKTGNIKNGDEIQLIVKYAENDDPENPQTETYSTANGGDITFELESGMTLEHFTLANSEDDSSKNVVFKIDGIRVGYEVTEFPDDFQLDFTLEGKDSEDDSASANFSVLVNTADEEGHYEIIGSNENDVIYGTDGDDTIYGADGDEVIYGKDGADVFDIGEHGAGELADYDPIGDGDSLDDLSSLVPEPEDVVS